VAAFSEASSRGELRKLTTARLAAGSAGASCDEVAASHAADSAFRAGLESAGDIEAAVAEQIGDAQVSVVVDGNRALITVVSAEFETLSRVQKQQKVYACIDDYIKDGRLHAVTIRALTPEEAGST